MNWIQVQTFVEGPHTFVGIEVFLPQKPVDGKKYPLVLLLHGRGADRTQWLRSVRLERYAEKAGVAIALVQGNQSFYVNSVVGYNWGDYLKEVAGKLSGWFPVQEKPVLMGVDMGGYGALMAAQRDPEAFLAAAAVDPVLDVRSLYGTDYQPKPEYIFGEAERLEENGYVLGKRFEIPVAVFGGEDAKKWAGEELIVQELAGETEEDRMEEAFRRLMEGGLVQWH